jgi:hypothetical protein
VVSGNLARAIIVVHRLLTAVQRWRSGDESGQLH